MVGSKHSARLPIRIRNSRPHLLGATMFNPRSGGFVNRQALRSAVLFLVPSLETYRPRAVKQQRRMVTLGKSDSPACSLEPIEIEPRDHDVLVAFIQTKDSTIGKYC